MLRMAHGTPILRAARLEDLAAICAIVNHYIAHTTVNLRDEPQTVTEWEAERQRTYEHHPWLVAEAPDGEGATRRPHGGGAGSTSGRRPPGPLPAPRQTAPETLAERSDG